MMSCLDLGKRLGVERAHSKRGPFRISCSVEQRSTLRHTLPGLMRFCKD